MSEGNGSDSGDVRVATSDDGEGTTVAVEVQTPFGPIAGGIKLKGKPRGVLRGFLGSFQLVLDELESATRKER